MKITYIFKKQVLHQQNNAPKKPAVVFWTNLHFLTNQLSELFNDTLSQLLNPWINLFFNKSVECMIQWLTYKDHLLY